MPDYRLPTVQCASYSLSVTCSSQVTTSPCSSASRMATWAMNRLGVARRVMLRQRSLRPLLEIRNVYAFRRGAKSRFSLRSGGLSEGVEWSKSPAGRAARQEVCSESGNGCRPSSPRESPSPHLAARPAGQGTNKLSMQPFTDAGLAIRRLRIFRVTSRNPILAYYAISSSTWNVQSFLRRTCPEGYTSRIQVSADAGTNAVPENASRSARRR